MNKKILLLSLSSLFLLSSCLIKKDGYLEKPVKLSKDCSELIKEAYLTESLPIQEVSIKRIGKSTINYIDLESFFSLLEKVYSNRYYDNGVRYTVTKEDDLYKVSRENGTYILVDEKENTIKFSNYDLFVSPSYFPAQQFLPDYGDLGTLESENINFIAKTKGYQEDTYQEVLLNLSDYGLDIKNVSIDDNAYIPFQTLSDVFMAPLYSGMEILSNGIFCPYAMESDSLVMAIYNQGYHRVNKELLNFNYYETCLNFDFNYGLYENKTAKRITSFDEFFKEKGLDTLMKKSVKTFENSLQNVLYYYLDDPHCYLLKESPSLESNDIFYPNYGKRYESLIDKYNQLTGGSWFNKNNYIDVYNDTIFLSFTSFDQMDDELYEKNYSTSSDAGSLFKRFYKRIMDDREENNEIKRIVIDITKNGGGDTRSGVFLASMLTGEVDITLYNEKTKSTGHSSYIADCNFDHKIDENDYIISKGDYEVYVLTSGYSFSCANFLPNAVKGKGNVKVVGEKSGGGACAVLPCTTIFGTVYSISSLMEILKEENGVMVSSDSGIDVDYEISSELFYQEYKLIEELKRYEQSLNTSE